MKKVLYVLLPQFAEHELPYLTQPLRSDAMAMKENPKYENKIVAETMEPVEAISGFRVLPDYTFDTIPDDYAALVLIGGYGWKSEATERVVPLVEDAIKKRRIVGAICNAASWMASKGFLNDVRHTGNGVEQLQLWGGERYTNAVNYVNAQAVSDKEYERAVSMGAKPIFAPTTEPWGQRTCYVADPEGNLIEISSFINNK